MTEILNLIPMIDTLFKKNLSIFLGLGISGWVLWAFYRVGHAVGGGGVSMLFSVG